MVVYKNGNCIMVTDVAKNAVEGKPVNREMRRLMAKYRKKNKTNLTFNSKIKKKKGLIIHV